MTTRAARFIDPDLINLSGDIFPGLWGLRQGQILTPPCAPRRAGRIIDDTLLILSGEIFADASAPRSAERPAPPARNRRGRAGRAAISSCPVPRPRWDPVAIIAGVSIGLAYAGGLLIGVEAMARPKECVERLAAARPFVEAAAAEPSREIRRASPR
jgi:hypothetical protein